MIEPRIFYVWQGDKMPNEWRCDVCGVPSYGYMLHVWEAGKGFLCRPHYEERKEMLLLSWLTT